MATPVKAYSAALPAGESRMVWACGGILALAALLAHANGFGVPLLFDDWSTFTDNPTLRQGIWSALTPPENTTLGGRPLASLSFVLNYALSGESVRGLHAGNLLIHFAATLALFGVIHRTLRLPRLRERCGGAAAWLGAAVAGLWMLHPLQTESVTYLSQRTEALMGLFYFLTLYAFVRATECNGLSRWSVLAVVSCFAGVASKEGMVTAPVVIFLYDYTFISGSLAEAWRRHWRLHVALAASWVLLALLMGGLQGRGVGFGRGMSAGTYLLIECRAIFHYLSLALWPSPLVFDYGTDLGPPGFGEALAAAGCLGLTVAAVQALRRWPPVGFLLAWFLITLVPTSSVVPIPLQPISENRIYVPLAAVLAGLVILIYRHAGRVTRPALIVAAAAFAVLTWARNRDYRSEVALWTDTVAKRPMSSRAHCNLGRGLQEAGRLEEAKREHELALRIKPDYADAHLNLAAVFGRLGQPDEALVHARRAAALAPLDQTAWYNLGVACNQKGLVNEAIAAYEAALRLRPDLADAHSNLALLLVQARRVPEALTHAQAALQLKPDSVDARYALGCALALSGRMTDAMPWFQEVVRARPAFADAHQNLGIALYHAGRFDDAIASFGAAVRANPAHLEARVNLANTLVTRGRGAEAIPHYEILLQVRPNVPDLHVNYGIALRQVGRRDDAAAQFRKALALDPNSAAAREQLAQLASHPPEMR